METLKALAAAAKARDGTAIDAVDRSTPYSYSEFGTNSFKAGNLLGHYGVHPGGSVAVVVGPKAEPTTESVPAVPDSADPLLAVLGGASLGATVDLTPATPVASRTLVRPDYQAWPVEPQCSVLAYGGPPTEPDVTHFERELWSENPTEPPEAVAETDPAVQFDGEPFTHEQLLATSQAVVSEYSLTEQSRVLLAADLTEPGALVAGVLAPLVAGATIVLPAGSGPPTDAEDLALVVDSEEAKTSRQSPVLASEITAQLRDTRRA